MQENISKKKTKEKKERKGREALLKVVARNEVDAGRDRTTRRRCVKFECIFSCS